MRVSPTSASRPAARPWWRPAPSRFLLAGVASVLLGTVTFAAERLAPAAPRLDGVTVDHVGALDAASLDAVVAERAAALEARLVEVHSGGVALGVVRLADLGVRVDRARVTRLARAQATRGDLAERLRALRSSRAPVDVPLLPTVDPAVALAVLERVKEAEDRPAVAARMDLEHHTVVPEQPGRYLDTDGALAALERLAREPLPSAGPVRLDLPVVPLPPRVTSAFVRSLDVHAVLSSYETYFSRSGEQSRRGQNIDVAAKKLDGLVLFPDELVSFNRVVGARSEENGFQKSWEIFKGEMKEGVGGGTCQVASTLHAAAFFGGLEILERLPHSRPSAYIPIGLDATVVYPVVDMKLKNPYPFPVVLHAAVEGNRLRMELLGKERPVRVSFSRELLRTYAYKRKVEEKEGLRARHVVLKQHGIRGFRVKRKRLLTYADGQRREEETTDFYPPTSEIYEVPPGFDEALLPPLPEDDVGEDLEHPTDAPSAAAPSDPNGAVASATPDAPASDDVVVESGRGAHAPSAVQANPPRKLTIRR